MELSKSEFDVLVALKLDFPQTQRDIARSRHLSLGAVNRAYRSLQEAGLINAFQLTPAGEKQLSTYRVDNAIIMAAGLSSRFAPISYERPKGVLMVRGEVLIERQVRQLQQAGITDITVVVGYMKESFFYLEDLFGVKIRVNEEYRQRNNNSTLMLVRNQLGNTYICSSDDYFTENVFEPYVYRAYYAGVYQDSPTDEYVMELGLPIAFGRFLLAVRAGGVCWGMPILTSAFPSSSFLFLNQFIVFLKPHQNCGKTFIVNTLKNLIWSCGPTMPR